AFHQILIATADRLWTSHAFTFSTRALVYTIGSDGPRGCCFVVALFSTALDMAEKFTLPVVFTRRFRSGNLSSTLGTFIVVNRDGWILTADHIVGEILKIVQSQAALQNYDLAKQAIENDSNIKPQEKRRRIQKLVVNDEWITEQAVLWGYQSWTMLNVVRDELADL